jgi:ribose transport system substrate-binding protein
MTTPPRKPYIVESVVHASQVLRAFASAGEALRLRDIVERTGFNKGQCFRMLHTLHHCGLLEKVDVSRYRRTFEIQRQTCYRIGYASQGHDGSFPREVHAGLLRAAEHARVELIVVDNCYQAKVALRNAQQLIREKIDLAIESRPTMRRRRRLRRSTSKPASRSSPSTSRIPGPPTSARTITRRDC